MTKLINGGYSIVGISATKEGADLKVAPSLSN